MEITRTGQRVQPRFSPENRGTVTAINPGHSFRVSYDSHNHRRGQPRMRAVFLWHDCHLFDPAGTEEIRIAESDHIEIPAALAERYGIAA